MVFKKPYAFLIKHFKAVHLVLALLTIYILQASYNIYAFLNDYVKNKYTINSYTGFSSEYVPFILFFAVTLVVIILFLMVLLFQNKKKKSKEYQFALIYYLFSIIILFVAKSILSTFETDLIAAETARIYRDFSLIYILFQIPFIIVFLIRTLGFNIKKFDFEKDLKDLEITSEDSEEFEISFNYEPFKIKRVIRRFIREFNYYVKENKFIFVCILITTVTIFGYLIFSNLSKDYNNTYQQNKSFIYKGLVINIKDSIVTNLDYKGDIIDNYYYLVLQTYIENNTSNDIDLKSKNIRLELNNEFLYPVNDKSNYFIDYAGEYYGKTIPKNTKNTYSLVYKINKEDIKNKYRINIYKGSITEKNKIYDTYDFIKINPILIDDVSVVTKKKINDEIVFSDSNLLNTKLTIKKYSITNQYVYDYQVCITDNDCRLFKDYINVSYKDNNKTLLVLDYSYQIDKNSSFALKGSSFSNFVETFAKVLYKNNANEYQYSMVKNVTPSRLNNTVVLEVDDYIMDSQEVSLSFKIRNKEYLVVLKK